MQKKADTPTSKPGRRPRPDGQPESDRRDELVRIAYGQIQEKGFEGLRVRDVAAKAGINHATLLYYFPTKEALIQGVVAFLIQEFQTSRVPRPAEAALTPLQELHLEFDDLRYRFREMPEMLVVLSELFGRARRDPALAKILQALDDGWRGYLVSILARGVETGAFRPDLDLPTTAMGIMVQLKGIGCQALAQPDPMLADRLIALTAAQIERWLTG